MHAHHAQANNAWTSVFGVQNSNVRHFKVAMEVREQPYQAVHEWAVSSTALMHLPHAPALPLTPSSRNTPPAHTPAPVRQQHAQAYLRLISHKASIIQREGISGIPHAFTARAA